MMRRKFNARIQPRRAQAFYLTFSEMDEKQAIEASRCNELFDGAADVTRRFRFTIARRNELYWHAQQRGAWRDQPRM